MAKSQKKLQKELEEIERQPLNDQDSSKKWKIKKKLRKTNNKNSGKGMKNFTSTLNSTRKK